MVVEKVYTTMGEIIKEFEGKKALVIEKELGGRQGILVDIVAGGFAIDKGAGWLTLMVEKEEHTEHGRSSLSNEFYIRVFRSGDGTGWVLPKDFYDIDHYYGKDITMLIYPEDPDSFETMVDITLDTKDEEGFYKYSALLNRYRKETKGIQLLTIEEHSREHFLADNEENYC